MHTRKWLLLAWLAVLVFFSAGVILRDGAAGQSAVPDETSSADSDPRKDSEDAASVGEKPAGEPTAGEKEADPPVKPAEPGAAT